MIEYADNACCLCVVLRLWRARLNVYGIALGTSLSSGLLSRNLFFVSMCVGVWGVHVFTCACRHVYRSILEISHLLHVLLLLFFCSIQACDFFFDQVAMAELSPLQLTRIRRWLLGVPGSTDFFEQMTLPLRTYWNMTVSELLAEAELLEQSDLTTTFSSIVSCELCCVQWCRCMSCSSFTFFHSHCTVLCHLYTAYVNCYAHSPAL